MSKIEIGNKFNRLLVLELIKDSKNPKAKCLCDCGNICYPQRGALNNGRATSCGCHRREQLVKAAKTHGMSLTPEYKIWRGILARCTNKNLPEYKNYGGRGIKVIWNSFEEFFADMGKRPAGAWIDRLDNNGNYEKNNCKWVAPKINQKNKRTSKFWIINNVAYETSIEAAKALNIDTSTVIRNCNGYKKNGIFYPPLNGWSAVFKYRKVCGSIKV